MTHQSTNRWHRWAVATLLALMAVMAMAGSVGAAPTPPAPPVPGAIGPIDPAVLQPQGTYTRPVQQNGYTVYVNTKGETVTGAIPMDAVRGFAPAPHGRSYGPDNLTPGCTPGDLPPQSVRDHATFTTAELKHYNLPSASDLGIPFTEWATMVRAVKHIACSSKMTYQDGHVVTHTLTSAGATHPQQPHAGQVTLDTCINFCGPEATPPGTNCPGTTVFYCIDRHLQWNIGEAPWMGFGTDRTICSLSSCPPLTEVVSYWHIPPANYKGFDFDDSVTWVGVGGLHYNPAATCSGTSAQPPSLVQAGTQSWHEGGHPAPGQYDAWYENCSSNTPGVYTLALTVNAGDLFVAYAGYSSSLHPGAIYLQDFTTGWSFQQLDGPGGGVIWPAPDQNTAECVAEDKADKQWYDGGVFHGMTDFGNYTTAGQGIHFEYCRAWTSYNTSTIMGIGSMPGNALDLWRNYVVDGTEFYCASTGWFDSFDATYGYTSYGITATVTYASGGSANC